MKSLHHIYSIWFLTSMQFMKRDSKNFHDAPASVYNVKKKNSRSPKCFVKIKKAFNMTDLFSFHEITEDENRKEI